MIQKKIWRDWRVIVGLFVAIVVIVGGYYLFMTHDLGRFFTNRQELERVIEQAGPMGPIVFMMMQVLQIIIAPIPGQAIALLGGYIFGGLLGTVYSMIGTVIGFTIVLLVSRRFGRPLIERFFDKQQIKKFDYLTNTAGPAVFFFIFLVPAFPDDMICYLAGLTKIRMSTLLVISFLGRFPSTLLTSYMGSGVAKADMKLIASIAIITMIVMALAYWKREWLEAQAHKLAQKIE